MIYTVYNRQAGEMLRCGDNCERAIVAARLWAKPDSLSAIVVRHKDTNVVTLRMMRADGTMVSRVRVGR